MTTLPSAESDGIPCYRAVILDACGGAVLSTLVSASGDDEAMDKAQALIDGHAIDLWDGFRFIERFEPLP